LGSSLTVALRPACFGQRYAEPAITDNSQEPSKPELATSKLSLPGVAEIHDLSPCEAWSVITFPAMAIRCQSVLLIVALLAVPLALLVRGIACDTTGMTCCASNGPSSQSQRQGMLCGLHQSWHAPTCNTKSGHQPLDYGFIAPMAPTTPEARVKLAAPSATRQSVAFDGLSTFSGFRSAPFEPPRS
jgi:hypothetical protein